jgi:DNA polymerase elongation subunit (family B)
MEIKSLTKEELKVKIEELTSLKNELKNEEQAVKLTMNSIYGAVGNNYFACFNTDVAEAVTLQGQDLIKYSEKIIHRYFHEFWHDDFELHEKLGVTDVKKVHKPLTIYGDTDSCFSQTYVVAKNSSGVEKLTIEELFIENSKFFSVILDERGNEIIEPNNLEALNYLENICFSPVKKIIRHKVTKPKWKITSASGKEILVTDDHSVTIFRDGNKLHIRPSEINLETDEIITIDIDI